MVNIETVEGMTPKQLKEFKSVLSFFRSIGFKDEDFKTLLAICRSWPTVVSNMNEYSQDLARIKSVSLGGLGAQEKDFGPESLKQSTYESVNASFGFGSDSERIYNRSKEDKR